MAQPAKHTPGPWELSSTHRDEQYIDEPKAEELRPLFRIHWDNDVTDHEAEQGANLIAAAPAMYEALKALHSVLDQRMPDGRTLNQHLSQEVFECFYGPAIAARAAIAKAEGV